MVSHSSHTKHEFLTLVIGVINVSFAIESFVTYEKELIMMLHLFSIRVFSHGYWQLTGQQGEVGDHLLFHFSTSTRSRTFRYLFVTLHVRSHIFNHTVCIYQIATRWDAPLYRITLWFIDMTLSFVFYLMIWF